jgi:hypothetical protein
MQASDHEVFSSGVDNEVDTAKHVHEATVRNVGVPTRACASLGPECHRSGDATAYGGGGHGQDAAAAAAATPLPRLLIVVKTSPPPPRLVKREHSSSWYQRNQHRSSWYHRHQSPWSHYCSCWCRSRQHCDSWQRSHHNSSQYDHGHHRGHHHLVRVEALVDRIGVVVPFQLALLIVKRRCERWWQCWVSSPRRSDPPTVRVHAVLH